MWSNTGTACVEIAFSSLFKRSAVTTGPKNATNEDCNAHTNNF